MISAPMTVAIRALRDGELDDFVRSDAAAWGARIRDSDLASARGVLEPARLIVAEDGGRLVGRAALLAFELTVPGELRVPMAGCTWVSVAPTHRRQGLLRQLMLSQLESLRDGGEALAGLGASESVIYRRFGYGVASRVAAVEIETRYGGFGRPFTETGSVELLTRERAMERLPAVYDRVRTRLVGAVDRTAGQWGERYLRSDEDKDGAGPVFFCAHRSSPGDLDGFVSYRVAERWTDHNLADNTLRLEELLAEDLTAYLSLWRYCLDFDLCSRVRCERRPVDEPLLHWLADFRRLRQSPSDDLHLRIVDVPRALSARRYGCDGALVLEVDDEVCPWVAGRWRLEGGPDGAACAATDAPADLRCDAAALGSLYLGAFPAGELARAGRLEELTSGAVRRAGAMLGWSPQPFVPAMF